MVLLIDTNIVLDVLVKRQNFYEDSLKIFKLCEIGKAEGHISSLSVANLVYIMRKELDSKEIEKVIKKLNLIFKFCDLTQGELLKASELKWNDYEDALQAYTAEEINASYIITRNVKDYSSSKIKAITPYEFINSNTI